jgi:eukaryotic-like serine/threonine-protein kinase
MIGRRIGPYEVLGKLGEGGMGEVYRARDTKLDRDVAIKILPEAFALDPDRLARFAREAKTLAALNHPNVAHIYGIEQSALVMELVEGDDLSAIIARGPIPLADAVPIARQVAEALEAAHEQGIIHRDLKPANIKVRPDGAVKVLDFGLAKAMDPPDPSGVNAMNSPTLTVRGTQMGVIVGTAAYMAPEQARGKAVDRRADIWAFGVVLYEMLTGRQAFKGDDISEVLATVLKTEPDWHALPSGTPPSISRLLRRCLEKDPRRRLSAIGDARLELDDTEPAVAAGAAAQPAQHRRTIGTPAAAALVGIAILVTAGISRFWFAGSAPPAPAIAGSPHLSMALPDGDEVAASEIAPLAVSPDGQRVVYVGRRAGKIELYMRTLRDPEPKVLAGTEGAFSPFFSPDGGWVGFFAQGKIKKVAVAGGAVLNVGEATLVPRGGAWGSDGHIYFARTNTTGLSKVAASGGTVTEVTTLDRAQGEISHRWPLVLPDGTLIFTVWTGPGPDERQIVAQPAAGGPPRVLVRGGDMARYAPQGYLLYARLDQLFAVPWRPSDSEMGTAPPIALNVYARMEGEGAAAYDISGAGTLVCVTGGAARYEQRLVWIDAAGTIEPLPLPARDYESVSISPDGTRALVQIREGTMGLWIYEFARRTLTPIVTGNRSSQAGMWMPDGKAIVYRGTRSGERNLYLRAADGTGDEQRLTAGEGSETPTAATPDGQVVVYNIQGRKAGGRQILSIRLDGPRPATPQVVVGIDGAANGQLSSDGRWLAYEMNESGGGSEVYIQPFPGPGARTRVSANGGINALWAPDGRRLFYHVGDELVEVPVQTSPALSFGTPRTVARGRFRAGPNAKTPFDISRDGRRFLRIQQAQPDRPLDRIDVVLNWLAEVTR